MNTSTSNIQTVVLAEQEQIKNVSAKELASARKDLMRFKFSDIVIETGFNARTDFGDLNALAQSIKENGLLVPLRGKVVGNKVVLTDGERRYRAIAILQAEGVEFDIAVQLEEKTMSDIDRVLNMIASNDGKPLTSVELADAIRRLTVLGMKGTDIAKRLGRSPAEISNFIKFASAPQEIKNQVESGELSFTTAIAVVRQEGSGAKAIETVRAAVASVTKASDGTAVKKVTKVTAKQLTNKKSDRDMLQELYDETEATVLLDLINYLKGRVPKEDIIDILNRA